MHYNLIYISHTWFLQNGSTTLKAIKIETNALRWMWHLQTTAVSHSSINFQLLHWHKEQKHCRFSIPKCVRACVSVRRGAERPSRSGGRDSATTSCIYSSALLSERMANDWVRLPEEGMNNHREIISFRKRRRRHLKGPGVTWSRGHNQHPPAPSSLHLHQRKEQQRVCTLLLERWRLTLSRELDLGCSAAGEVVGVC